MSKSLHSETFSSVETYEIDTTQSQWLPDAMAPIFEQEWILVDWKSGGKVIICDSKRPHVHQGASLSDFFDPDTQTMREIKAHLCTGIPQPMLLSCKQVMWLLLLHLYPASGCVLLTRLQVPPKVLYGFAQNGEMGDVYISDSAIRESLPLNDSFQDAYEATHNWWFTLRSCMPKARSFATLSEVSGEIFRLAQAYANFFYVPLEIVRVKTPEPAIASPSTFHFDFFMLYTIVFFRLYHRYGKGHSIKMFLDTTRENLGVQYFFKSSVRAGVNVAKHSPEMTVCSQIAQRYEQVLSALSRDAIFSIKFYPTKDQASAEQVRSRPIIHWI